MEFRKKVMVTLYARQQKRHRWIEHSFGLCGRGLGWDDMGEWHWNMYNIICETNCQSRFDAWYRVLRAGALGWPRGMEWTLGYMCLFQFWFPRCVCPVVGLLGHKAVLTEPEDRISEVEDRMVEINESERKKEKWIKRNEDNLRDLWDSVKSPNIWIIGVPEEEEKKRDHEKILEIIAENFPKMGKEIITQVQETQRVPNRINPRQNTPRHILIKLTNIKHKEQILKAAREKQQITHKGTPIRIIADLSVETLQARREW